MELTRLASVELTYTAFESIDYASGGQHYGTLEGIVTGERLAGRLRLSNLTPRRADDATLPTLRGVLTTSDGGSVWVELDGIATRRGVDGARVLVASCRFRSGDDRYRWLNTTFGLVEGVLGPLGVGAVVRGRLYACHATVTTSKAR